MIECEPSDKPPIVNCAVPPPSDVVPSEFEPSIRVTVPVGVPEVVWTDTLNVTDCPKAAGFKLEETLVVAAP